MVHMSRKMISLIIHSIETGSHRVERRSNHMACRSECPQHLNLKTNSCAVVSRFSLGKQQAGQVLNEIRNPFIIHWLAHVFCCLSIYKGSMAILPLLSPQFNIRNRCPTFCSLIQGSRLTKLRFMVGWRAQVPSSEQYFVAKAAKKTTIR